MDFVIEGMKPSDWELVGAIYLEGIATRTATFETEAPNWEEWDAGHLPGLRLVARKRGHVLGWAALSLVSTRRVHAGVAEVSVYVGAGFVRRGIGRALLEALIALSEEHSIWTLQAGIFSENVASLELCTKCGFREVGRRERLGQLDGVWRDVLLLERRSQVAGT